MVGYEPTFLFIPDHEDKNSDEKYGYSIPIYSTIIKPDGKIEIHNGISNPKNANEAMSREYEINNDL